MENINILIGKIGGLWEKAWTWVATHPKTTVGVAIGVVIILMLT